jgi:hypothetical protein
MRLKDLTATESPDGAGWIRFETLIADITGSEDHRLVGDHSISGTNDLLAKRDLSRCLL